MAIPRGHEMFGKINVYDPEGGKKRVEIYIRLNQTVEGMRVGIAVDGSASMLQPVFAAHIPKFIRPPGANVAEPVVRALGAYVCQYSGDGQMHFIYWATGPGGQQVEPVGAVTAEMCAALEVEGPKAWGTGTQLLPAISYYMTEFADAKWAFVLFVTDGVIEDMEAVKARCLEVGQEMVDGKRGKCKFVIVGIGEADPEQLEELDNMFEGTDLEGDVDLWDAKEAAEMRELTEIWDEVDFGITLPGSARITDSSGNQVASWADGFPQKMEFEVVESVSSVRIEIGGMTIEQSLVDE